MTRLELREALPDINTAPAPRSGDVPTLTGEQRKQLLFLLEGTDPGLAIQLAVTSQFCR